MVFLQAARTGSLALLLLVVGASQRGIAAPETGKTFLSFEAEVAYWSDYVRRGGAKAFAIGPFGAYGWSWSYRSQKEANKQALKTCQGTINKYALWYKQKIKGTCSIFAEGERAVLPAPWGKGLWQTPAEGPDLPLTKGVTYIYTAGPAKGVVLALHGCDGLGAEAYNKVWATYFNSLKFNFFAPNSFADVRPGSICGGNDLALQEQESEIIRKRVAQTHRSIVELRKKFPGLPIYVWGHSEGSAVAKVLNAKVAGIIASGDICDRYGMPLPSPPGVPILFIFGENDSFSTDGKLPITPKSVARCKRYLGGRKLNAVIVKDAKHDIWPWRPEVAKAFSKFLTGAEVPLPAPPLRVAIELPGPPKAELPRYAAAGAHKAFAVHPDGAYSWVGDMGFATDAENWAAYDCGFVRYTNPFIDGKHSCTIQMLENVTSASPAR